MIFRDNRVLRYVHRFAATSHHWDRAVRNRAVGGDFNEGIRIVHVGGYVSRFLLLAVDIGLWVGRFYFVITQRVDK